MSVYQAINRVQQAMAAIGIAKDRRNDQQNYKFRGIDDVYNALSSVMSKEGLCIIPEVLERICSERQTAKGGVLFAVVVKVSFAFVSAEDGSKHTVVTYGEAMDSGDKATNKAMSAAYKYAVLMTFAIPTVGDNDADATTHDVTSRTASPVSPFSPMDAVDQIATAKDIAELKQRFVAAITAARASGQADCVTELTRAKDIRKAKLEQAAGSAGA